MFIRFQQISNFSDFLTFSFNIFISVKYFFLNKKFPLFLKTVSYRICEDEISETFGMVPIVFTFPEKFEPYLLYIFLPHTSVLSLLLYKLSLLLYFFLN